VIKRVLFIVVLIIALCELSLGATAPKMRRVCRQQASTDNRLFFFPSTDTCSLFYKYYVWARNGTAGPFSILDSISNKGAETYLHVNANPGTPTLWYYFVEYVDSCGPDFSVFSDTLVVDNLPPDTVFIDSVSVDITTGNMQIGWKGNRAPDFLNYSLYRIDNTGNPVDISPGGTRDTVWLDMGVNGNNGSQTYDLLSRDSCNNPRVFGINPHTSMFLIFTADTCNQTLNLQWSRYRGWTIRSQYLYRRINGGTWSLLDSFDSNILIFNDSYFTGNSHEYFVRAFADSIGMYSSSSNRIVFNSRFRNDPDEIVIHNITNNADGTGPIKVTLEVVNGGEAGRVLIDVTGAGIQNEEVIRKPVNPFEYSFSGDNNKVYSFKAKTNDLCDVFSATSKPCNNLLLTAELKNSDIMLMWNKNPVWQVDYYTVYRAVVNDLNNISFSSVATASASDSVYTDLGAFNLSGKFGVYYVISANRTSSPGNLYPTMYSNRVIVKGETAIYIPNAFVPSGLNNQFNVRGSYLDFKKSSIEIFDRWGGLVFAKQDLTAGWDGRDNDGVLCPVGVYLYQFTIFDLDGKEYKKIGTVTLLN
jgi:gliding motility-associated-like protein